MAELPRNMFFQGLSDTVFFSYKLDIFTIKKVWHESCNTFTVKKLWCYNFFIVEIIVKSVNLT